MKQMFIILLMFLISCDNKTNSIKNNIIYGEIVLPNQNDVINGYYLSVFEVDALGKPFGKPKCIYNIQDGYYVINTNLKINDIILLRVSNNCNELIDTNNNYQVDLNVIEAYVVITDMTRYYPININHNSTSLVIAAQELTYAGIPLIEAIGMVQ